MMMNLGAGYVILEGGTGTMAELQELAADLHTRGMALCIDLVLNHTAAEHPWARQAQAGNADDAGNIYRVELPIVAQIRAQAGNVFSLTWNAVSGRSYQAQHKSGCSQTNWSNLGASITATNRTATALDYDGAQAQQFYRVIRLP